jgi:hypothetical protein
MEKKRKAQEKLDRRLERKRAQENGVEAPQPTEDPVAPDESL